MLKTLFALLSAGSFLITACRQENDFNSNPEDALIGTWVRVDDAQGRQPADTLRFLRKDGKNLLAFYCAGSPGPNWPSEAETEYKFENGKLLYRNYSGTNTDFYTVESFAWLTNNKFSVKLHQVLLYMSADYLVTYQKI